ncbi:M15 family metallopeptidase [Paenibacillus vini]|uniref:M15 family metallopeptidase n=1 Tax=Paenibacillus vini TaxID=1476024 RepID=UPI0025B65866|nr:M15 family metallopeptidase [Paenibacillus vini]MDN4069280.1 M15 family metallopeptidase [Paenibacillus vini]MDN4069333.1 M15 family metallopeptidase [Paenibacillus vini]
MRYDKRNRTALDNLAPNTKAAAYKWYQFCLDNNIDILITETIRTKEKQAEYVAKGTSQTMRSWHLVGQALDFVPVTSTGGTDYTAYFQPDIQRAIAEAKRLGFKWGGDWSGGWDKPHLEYQYKGYGMDKKLEQAREDEEPMTAEEKKQFDELKELVKKQADTIKKLEKAVNVSGNQSPPEWSLKALEAAKKAGAITTTKDKSQSDLVNIQVLYNLGLFDPGIIKLINLNREEVRNAK